MFDTSPVSPSVQIKYHLEALFVCFKFCRFVTALFFVVGRNGVEAILELGDRRRGIKQPKQRYDASAKFRPTNEISATIGDVSLNEHMKTAKTEEQQKNNRSTLELYLTCEERIRHQLHQGSTRQQ